MINNANTTITSFEHCENDLNVMKVEIVDREVMVSPTLFELLIRVGLGPRLNRMREEELGPIGNDWI